MKTNKSIQINLTDSEHVLRHIKCFERDIKLFSQIKKSNFKNKL